MPANIESLAYTKLAERDVPWHGLGVPIDHAMTSAEAQKMSGLDWIAFFAPVEAVITLPGSLPDAIPVRKSISHRFAVVRDKDLMCLGVVSDDYRIVQNSEAFAFTDHLIGMGVKYETAGAIYNPYNGSVKTFMLAKTDHITVLGDRVEPYCVFMNSFDGKSGMIAAMTPVRVVCQNTLTMALDRAQRMWMIKHVGDIQGKIEEAKRALGLMNDYVAGFPEIAEKLNAINLYDDEIKKFLDELFPAPTEGDTDRRKDNREYMKGVVMNRFTVPEDIQKFRGNAWGLYNAVSDAITHMQPMRKTQNWRANRFLAVVDGHAVIQRAQNLLMKIVA
jgi:phage/plasmid-like protein (TIGR03299 family)